MDQVRQVLLEGRRLLPKVGAMRAGRTGLLPFVVVDADGVEIEPFLVFCGI